MNPSASSSSQPLPTQEDSAARAEDNPEPDSEDERTRARKAALRETRKRRLEATSPWLEESEALSPRPEREPRGAQVSTYADPPAQHMASKPAEAS